jgi:hypothetical protein
MKTKLIISVLLAVIISSCQSPAYLPDVDDIDVNVYGSYISIERDVKDNVDGELISIDSSNVIVLAEIKDAPGKIVVIPVSEIKSFKLQYATGNGYVWAIPLFTLSTLAHGFYALATLPINLIVTTIVASNGSYGAYIYSEQEISFDKLKMFARFPQGIPPGVKIGSIK